MEQRISTLIAEYSSQGIHRTGTEVDHRSADWLIAKISALGVEATETAFGFQRLQPLECSLRLGQLTVPGVPLYDCSYTCLLYTSPSPRDRQKSRMPSSA